MKVYKDQISGDKKITYRSVPLVLDLPDLIELQKDSYAWFIKEGIKEVFEEISPVLDFTGNLILEFLEHELSEPQASIQECRDRDTTFARPLKVKVRLITKEAGEVKEIKEQEIFLGDLPYMTPKGTFVINGAERVIVSQLVRSPGVYFHEDHTLTGKKIFGATMIPDRGAWLEMETDAADHIGVRIDKTRRIPVTALLRALGYASDEDILEQFDHDPFVVNMLAKDAIKTQDEGLIEIYRKIRPGDPPSVESAKTLLQNLFFDPKRYHLAKVGRYKINKKLGMKIICDKCGTLHKTGILNCPDCAADLTSAYSQILSHKDIITTIRYLLALMHGMERFPELGADSYEVPVNIDDIDHLGNRRIRAVGELLQNQFRVGLLRVERVARERMTVQDLATVTPQALINIRPLVASIKEFFGSSQLSQFMDQTNSLAELTHKRRLSALGPGGLSRERAGFEVRDVHYSHYGRICPIETPEGPNIGLIGSLASYGKVNEFGFIMTPYRKVVNGIVTEAVEYLTADEEDEYIVAQASTPIDEKGKILGDKAVARDRHETNIVHCNQVQYMDICPHQIVSIATSLIPFLEHDDANRALMGSNMQRQAVPLVQPQSPLVSTGIEYRAAKDSGALLVSDVEGVATSVNALEITVQTTAGKKVVFPLVKFARSNSGTCINHRPTVHKGEHIQAGQVLADGASSVKGELSLGRNVLAVFMPWEGYNYEDAILISEDLVKEDVFTSIHIEEYECEARDTKLGAEEITRDIANVGEEALANLDEQGVIRIGSEVHPEDILVGKVTPKGETELTAEERLLRAIFGEKARDVRDTSLRVRHGEKGKVIATKVFSRENGDELPPGVNKFVRVYIAQKRKISQGDKMAGRHGNKGVIAKILPVEDMPFLPDGTPVQIVLNPLGVPSRMNIGQVLETHLGGALEMLGMHGICPVFDSAKEIDIKKLMKLASFKSYFAKQYIHLDYEELHNLVDELPLAERLKDYLHSKGLTVTDAEIRELTSSDDVLVNIKKLFKKRKIPFVLEEVSHVVEERSLESRMRELFNRRGIQKSESEIKHIAAFVNGYHKVKEDGKSVLFDGKTGEPFDNRIMVGQIYMMKLAHMVEDKIHARSTGPYSLITQQPLGGKAQFGGQRFGEMEVWALEAYGAAHILQELLTVKSDDVVGRVKTYEAIVKGENVIEPGVPESFKVLVKELQSLCLDVKIMSSDEIGRLREVELKDVEEQDIRTTARELGLDLGEALLRD